MKKRKILATLTSAAIMTSIFAAMPLSADAAKTYTPLTGGTTSFDKYLVMDEGANVPNVSFEYTVDSGTAQNFNSTNGTIAVYAGPTPQNIVFSGSGITDSVTTDKKFNISFTSNDSTTVYSNKPATDYVKNLDSGEKYAKKTASLDFSAVSFTEPGIYRYIITETNETSAPQGITYDSDSTRVLDVYVVDSTTGTTPSLSVSNYILHASDDTVTFNNTTYGSDGNVVTGSTDSKSQGFTNEYTSHDLTISKNVSGNQASKDKYFQFTANIYGAVEGTKYTVSYGNDNNENTADGNADVDIAANPNSATTVITSAVTQPGTLTADSNGTVTGTFYLQNGQRIVIRGLAVDTKYTITDGKEDYKASYTTTDTKDSTAVKADVAANSAGIESDVSVAFTNIRQGQIPTGVILSVAAPAVLGIIVLAAIILLVVKNRRREAEEE